MEKRGRVLVLKGSHCRRVDPFVLRSLLAMWFRWLWRVTELTAGTLYQICTAEGKKRGRLAS